MWIPHLCSNCVAPFPSIIKARLPDFEKTTPQRCSPLLLQMQNLGIISNLVNGLSSPELLLPSPVRPQWSLMNDYDLLFCLRRDSNKVQSYLKILKCRIVPENDCWSPKERETAHSQTPFANHFNGDEWVTIPDQTLVERTWFSICTFRGSLRLCWITWQYVYILFIPPCEAWTKHWTIQCTDLVNALVYCDQSLQKALWKGWIFKNTK